MTNAEKTDEWYKDYYVRKGPDRNDPLRSAEVTFQSSASDIALIRALGRIAYQPQQERVLDVGGATGGGLVPFMYVGAYPELLTSVDIRPEAVSEGKRRFPGIDFRCIDACNMPIEADSFDIVYSSTMFVTIPDDRIAMAIAAEMVRVTRPGRFLLVRDWLFPKPGDPHYSALTRTRLRKLFPGLELVFVEKGSLIPPVGRFLSARLPALYFPVRACLPFLTGLGVYALRKP